MGTMLSASGNLFRGVASEPSKGQSRQDKNKNMTKNIMIVLKNTLQIYVCMNNFVKNDHSLWRNGEKTRGECIKPTHLNIFSRKITPLKGEKQR